MKFIKNVNCLDCADFGKTCIGLLLARDTPEERERLTHCDCPNKAWKTPGKEMAG